MSFLSSSILCIGLYCSLMLITVIMTPSATFAHSDSRNETLFSRWPRKYDLITNCWSFHVTLNLINFLTCSSHKLPARWMQFGIFKSNIFIKISISKAFSVSSLKPARAQWTGSKTGESHETGLLSNAWSWQVTCSHLSFTSLSPIYSIFFWKSKLSCHIGI